MGPIDRALYLSIDLPNIALFFGFLHAAFDWKLPGQPFCDNNSTRSLAHGSLMFEERLQESSLLLLPLIPTSHF